MTPEARVRPPAVAGSFYPAYREELVSVVDRLLDEAGPGRGPRPRALVVPHAGYVYSGGIAANAYALLREHAARIRRVLLLGPAHRVALRGLALPESCRFATPLGEIAVDATARETLRGLPGVIESEEPHEKEHSLEVQLPFLQRILGAFELVPLVVGDATPEQVATVIDKFWDDPTTLVLVSTDLSHYLTWDVARKVDERTAGRIVSGAHVEPHQACGAYPLNGLLRVARERDLRVRRLDLRNSGDTAGARDRVVGYGAFALYEEGWTR